MKQSSLLNGDIVSAVNTPSVVPGMLEQLLGWTPLGVLTHHWTSINKYYQCLCSPPFPDTLFPSVIFLAIYVSQTSIILAKHLEKKSG